MISYDNILETIKMIEKEKLDIRTITMGISLLDTAHGSCEIGREKVYDKIVKRAENLVKVGERLLLLLNKAMIWRITLNMQKL